MSLSPDLINGISSLVANSGDNTSTSVIYYGTAVVDSAGKYVLLDGAMSNTPIADGSVDIKNGDRVTVTIQNHSAIVTSNLTIPASGYQATDLYKETVVGGQTELSGKVVDLIQESSDGKTKNYYSATAPTGTDFTIGDTWYDTSKDYAMSNWNGTEWVPYKLGPEAIGALKTPNIDAGAITTDKISANAIGATAIAAGAITTDKLAANSVTAAKINVTDLFAQNIEATGTINGATIIGGEIKTPKLSGYSSNYTNVIIGPCTYVSSTVMKDADGNTITPAVGIIYALDDGTGGYVIAGADGKYCWNGTAYVVIIEAATSGYCTMHGFNKGWLNVSNGSALIPKANQIYYIAQDTYWDIFGGLFVICTNTSQETWEEVNGTIGTSLIIGNEGIEITSSVKDSTGHSTASNIAISNDSIDMVFNNSSMTLKNTTISMNQDNIDLFYYSTAESKTYNRVILTPGSNNIATIDGNIRLTSSDGSDRSIWVDDNHTVVNYSPSNGSCILGSSLRTGGDTVIASGRSIKFNLTSKLLINNSTFFNFHSISDSASVSANSYEDISIPASYSGYVPVAIAGWSLTGTGSTKCSFSRLFLDGNNITGRIISTYTSTATPTVVIYVLYISNYLNVVG